MGAADKRIGVCVKVSEVGERRDNNNLPISIYGPIEAAECLPNLIQQAYVTNTTDGEQENPYKQVGKAKLETMLPPPLLFGVTCGS